MDSTYANIVWGIVAGIGMIVAAIGLLWIWLGAALTLPALWTLVGGCMLAVAGAVSIVE